ncbi:syntaxinlike t-SNARE protein TLG2, putative [Acanthamoeba castellanii str. Neff]|uniref:Syntaxinlike t-SNARE protein TLG2, putative n=1 Tax=Acanthamoeba castellanii (strain ATCC 30010 / Neff) TaxID=1257118 RepID=L8GY87_ACACF|nr:syntaxinlike t-SNARE protein TLG2, putative [Acanthamoeba castellanii str. Neff]ELR17917.1 syntaxinlike t-SNARE protein TLG2, putative [Acanthamoeba castellanii str. Neff]
MAGTDELRINVPPAWLRLVDESHYDLERVKSKMKELDGMHKKHLLPGFDDRDAEEIAIQLLTGEITQLMQKCQQRVVKLGNIKKGISDEQLRLKQNIRLSLAGELQELSSVFRQSRGGALHSGDRDMEGVDLYGGMSAQDEEMMADTGFSGSQIKQIAVLEEDVDQRSRDIVSVQESIVQLAELFKDLAVLLVEQGTILDRIDYNIEHTWENIDKSVAELGQAEKYQKKTGYKLCMLLLLFIIAGLIIALGLKVIL